MHHLVDFVPYLIGTGFFFAFIFVNIIICKYLYINLHIENKKQTSMKVNEVKVQYSKKIIGKVSNSQTAADYCKSIPEFENRMEYQEVFAAVYIDTANNILCHQIIGIGTISAAMADIRIIMSTALKTLATKILLCHNHPSGTLKPSDADIKLTKEIKNAALFFNIQVIDHIILTKESYFSFADNCIL